MRHFNLRLYALLARYPRATGRASRLIALRGDVRLNKIYYRHDKYGWEMIDPDDREHWTHQPKVPMQFKKTLYE